MFDPYVAILDDEALRAGRVRRHARCSLQDPVASLIAPEDGTYVIQVRDSATAASGNCHYRLHVGTFPRPRVVFPPGGQAGRS